VLEQKAVEILMGVIMILLTLMVKGIFSDNKMKKLGDEIQIDIKNLSENIIRLLQKEVGQEKELLHIRENQAKLFEKTDNLEKDVAHIKGSCANHNRRD